MNLLLTVVKQLSQWPALTRPSCLCAIHCVEGLIQEEAYRPAKVHPCGTVGIEGWIVPKQSQEVDDDEAEASECDLGGKSGRQWENERESRTALGLRARVRPAVVEVGRELTPWI